MIVKYEDDIYKSQVNNHLRNSLLKHAPYKVMAAEEFNYTKMKELPLRKCLAKCYELDIPVTKTNAFLLNFLIQFRQCGANRRRVLIPNEYYHMKGVDLEKVYRLFYELSKLDWLQLYTYKGNVVVKLQYHTLNKTMLKSDGFPKLTESSDKRKNALLERRFTRECHDTFDDLILQYLE